MLSTQPQESLRSLQQAVTGHSNWRILTGGENDQPRFVIEKPVRYRMSRGWQMDATYQVIGGFQQSKSGETTLRYAVSGKPGIPFFHTVLIVAPLLIIAFMLGSLAFNPSTGGNLIAIALAAVLLVSAIGYMIFAYRSYQKHLQDLNHFMEAFAQRRGKS
jgi:hypothetical protein